jgi:hypothetical protein
MRSTCLLVIGLSAWAALAVRQTGAPAALPATLRDHLRDERFQIVSSLRGLPLGVRDGLQTLFGTQTLDIAEPEAEFQVRDAPGSAGRPTRRMAAAGCSTDHCLVYYERGGSAHAWLVVLFHWTPAATRFEWGGTASRGLANVEEMRRAVVAGTVKGPVAAW